MAYNPYSNYSYTPSVYNPPTYPQIQNYPLQTQQSGQNGLLWVQGEAGAKSYLVAPNTTVMLLDSEGARFYLKSTDGTGIPQLRTFEYKEIVPNAPQPQIPQENLDEKFVKREEFAALQEQYKEILQKLNGITAVKETKKQKGGEINE